MNPVLCIHVPDSSLYIICVFYSSRIRTLVAMVTLSPIRMRKKYTRVNILRCVFILRCANQPESKFKLRSHGFYRQEYFCR